jgi:hypothetical protein
MRYRRLIVLSYTKDVPSANIIQAAQMKTLGVNTIRVYLVDAKNNHRECMETFAKQGIYALVHLENLQSSIRRVILFLPIVVAFQANFLLFRTDRPGPRSLSMHTPK